MIERTGCGVYCGLNCHHINHYGYTEKPTTWEIKHLGLCFLCPCLQYLYDFLLDKTKRPKDIAEQMGRRRMQIQLFAFKYIWLMTINWYRTRAVLIVKIGCQFHSKYFGWDNNAGYKNSIHYSGTASQFRALYVCNLDLTIIYCRSLVNSSCSVISNLLHFCCLWNHVKPSIDIFSTCRWWTD